MNIFETVLARHQPHDPDAGDWESWCISDDCVDRDWPCEIALLCQMSIEMAERLEWFEARRGHPNHLVRVDGIGWSMDHPIDCRPNVRDCWVNFWLDTNAMGVWAECGSGVYELTLKDGDVLISRFGELDE